MPEERKIANAPPDISEQDILDAMKTIQGFVDITPGDFKEVYQAAYATAVQRIFNTLKASDLMTQSVLSLDQHVELVQAAALLSEKQISGAPVVNHEGEVVGVVSEKDFLREMGFGTRPSFMQIATHCLHDQGCMIGKLRCRTVGEIMTKPPVTGTPGMTVGTISALFVDRKINRLPIVDRHGQIVGIVTRTDLAHSYSFCGERL